MSSPLIDKASYFKYNLHVYFFLKTAKLDVNIPNRGTSILFFRKIWCVPDKSLSGVTQKIPQGWDLISAVAEM